MESSKYVLDKLLITGFRAFLAPKEFDFGSKRSLAVFAPNGSGKSSIVDALEFILSKEGTLDRLGLRAINNQAGVGALVHNLATEAKVEPWVRASFMYGRERLAGERTALGPARPRPEILEAVIACFVVDPLIRGYALRQFVETQSAEDRYQDVARWLQLGPLVDVQRNLRLLRQRAKAAAESRESIRQLDKKLAQVSGRALDSWNDEGVLRFANEMLRKLDEALSLGALSRDDPSFVALESRSKAEANRLGLQSLQQLRRSVIWLFDQKLEEGNSTILATGLIVQFEGAVRARATAEANEAAERSASANSVFEGLWRIAEPLFAVGPPALDTCPICTTPISQSPAESVEGIHEHLAARLLELRTYAKAKQAQQEASVAVRKLYDGLIVGLENLARLLTNEQVEVELELKSYLEAARNWTGGDPPSSTLISKCLNELATALTERINEIEGEHVSNITLKSYQQLSELIQLKADHDECLRDLAERARVLEAVNVCSAFVSGQIRARIGALLATLQNPINGFYRKIQGEDAAPIRLELPPEDDTNQQRLNLVIDFAENRTSVQPAGYLSDSQIHSLALALRLAAIKRFNTAAPIVVLDDIVTSYDADHRRLIAGLLASEFEGIQVILTTHDERFFNYLKDQIGDANWQYKRITRLDKDYGPRFVDHKVTDAMIEARWIAGESAANEMRQAEEEWLLAIGRDFGVNVRIRSTERAYSYERSELAAAIAQFLKERRIVAPPVAGVNNRFLSSLERGVVENFGSHFSDAPYGDGSLGDEKARWSEFNYFRGRFACSKCGRSRFKRPIELAKPVCANESCEEPFQFADRG